jgi:hypothetical protein
MTRTQRTIVLHWRGLAVVCAIVALFGVSLVLWHRIDSQDREQDLRYAAATKEADLRGTAVSTLAGDVRALRQQVKAGGETPVAPDPTKAVANLPARAEVPVPIPGPPGPSGSPGVTGTPGKNGADGSPARQANPGRPARPVQQERRVNPALPAPRASRAPRGLLVLRERTGRTGRRARPGIRGRRQPTIRMLWCAGRMGRRILSRRSRRRRWRPGWIRRAGSTCRCRRGPRLMLRHRAGAISSCPGALSLGP